MKTEDTGGRKLAGGGWEPLNFLQKLTFLWRFVASKWRHLASFRVVLESFCVVWSPLSTRFSSLNRCFYPENKQYALFMVILFTLTQPIA